MCESDKCKCATFQSTTAPPIQVNAVHPMVSHLLKSIRNYANNFLNVVPPSPAYTTPLSVCGTYVDRLWRLWGW
jgi:hypothetical protein